MEQIPTTSPKPKQETDQRQTILIETLSQRLATIARDEHIDVTPTDIDLVTKALVQSYEQANDPLTLEEIDTPVAEFRSAMKRALVERVSLAEDIPNPLLVADHQNRIIAAAETPEQQRQIMREHGAAQ